MFVKGEADGSRPNSGHIFQMLVLQNAGRFVGVANTHLKWDPPKVPRDNQFGYRQIKQLLSALKLLGSECSGWVICGDLNVTMDSDIVAELHGAGFEFSHSGFPVADTCNPNGRAKMIDFVFHDRALLAEPVGLRPIDDETPLPGPGQPSDHVAVVTKLKWRDLEDKRA